jgi:YD repeat-containing protein
MSALQFQPAPLRNGSVEGYFVYTHSGEFAPHFTDLTIPGRGLSFQLMRAYRSAQPEQEFDFGRGWTCTYGKQVERNGDCVLYHDGDGRVHRFTYDATRQAYDSPPGIYALLESKCGKILLRQRYGIVFIFADFDAGGKLLAIEDRNANALTFEYASGTVQVIDPLGHGVTFTYNQNRVVEVRDHAGRIWQYRYDDNSSLLEVIQPPTDESHRARASSTATTTGFGWWRSLTRGAHLLAQSI